MRFRFLKSNLSAKQAQEYIKLVLNYMRDLICYVNCCAYNWNMGK